jgi:hypothetical protein
MPKYRRKPVEEVGEKTDRCDRTESHQAHDWFAAVCPLFYGDLFRSTKLHCPGQYFTSTTLAEQPILDEHEQPSRLSVTHKGWKYFLNTSGFFYPTRLHERPGRYEDETRPNAIWEFRPNSPDSRWWLLGSPKNNEDGFWDIPRAHDYSPVAVRWVGELDDEQ